jgi:hypothetical protein
MNAKRIVLLVTMVGILAATAVAEDPFSLHAGVGLYYNAVPLPEGPLGFLAVLGNVRGGGYVNLVRAFAGSMSAGGEVGLQYVQVRAQATDTWASLLDVQVRAVVPAELGGVGLVPYGGMLWKITAVPGGTSFVTSVEAGARAILAGWYLETGYAVRVAAKAANHLRFAVGRRLELLRF